MGIYANIFKYVFQQMKYPRINCMLFKFAQHKTMNSQQEKAKKYTNCLSADKRTFKRITQIFLFDIFVNPSSRLTFQYFYVSILFVVDFSICDALSST